VVGHRAQDMPIILSLAPDQALYLRRKLHEWHRLNYRQYKRKQDEVCLQKAVMIAGIEVRLTRELVARGLLSEEAGGGLLD
jgi:hypothetical protein